MFFSSEIGSRGDLLIFGNCAGLVEHDKAGYLVLSPTMP